jgi:hypothetical protein
LSTLDLFDPTPPAEPRRERKQLWEIVDHLCARCGGRVLMGKGKAFRCSDCGHTGSGLVETVCCCGAKSAADGELLRCERAPEGSPREIWVKGVEL